MEHHTAAVAGGGPPSISVPDSSKFKFVGVFPDSKQDYIKARSDLEEIKRKAIKSSPTINCVAVIENSTYGGNILTASCICIYSDSGRVVARTRVYPRLKLRGIAWSPDGNKLACSFFNSGNDSNAVTQLVNADQVPPRVEEHRGVDSCGIIIFDTSVLTVQSLSGSSALDLKQLILHETLREYPLTCAFSLDSQKIAICTRKIDYSQPDGIPKKCPSIPKIIKICDIDNISAPIGVIDNPCESADGIVAVDFIPNGRIIVASNKHEIQIYGPHEDDPFDVLYTLTHSTSPADAITCMELSPNRRYAATIGSRLYYFYIWDLNIGEDSSTPLHRIPKSGLGGPMQSLSWSRNNEYLCYTRKYIPSIFLFKMSDTTTETSLSIPRQKLPFMYNMYFNSISCSSDLNYIYCRVSDSMDTLICIFVAGKEMEAFQMIKNRAAKGKLELEQKTDETKQGLAYRQHRSGLALSNTSGDISEFLLDPRYTEEGATGEQQQEEYQAVGQHTQQRVDLDSERLPIPSDCPSWRGGGKASRRKKPTHYRISKKNFGSRKRNSTRRNKSNRSTSSRSTKSRSTKSRSTRKRR
jgi:hypothetical protein